MLDYLRDNCSDCTGFSIYPNLSAAAYCNINVLNLSSLHVPFEELITCYSSLRFLALECFSRLLMTCFTFKLE